MNELDRKIAELKGYKEGDYGMWLPADPKVGWSEPHSLNWSTSDAKAFELADELREWNFDLFRGVRGYTKWIAMFEYRVDELVLTSQQFDFPFFGEGPTRPEAICRAYIAAREWAGKEKRG